MVNQFTSPIAFDAARFITIYDNQPRTTSLQVAEAFGKQHKNVIQKLESLNCSIEFNQLNFKRVEYMDGKGEKRPAYEMTKDGFIFLVMGFTGQKAAAIKEAYINAFNMMALQLMQRTNYDAKHQNINAMINYALMLSEREKHFIDEERQLKAKFKMLEAAMAEYQAELESYTDRRRQYRDIVGHLQLAGNLTSR